MAYFIKKTTAVSPGERHKLEKLTVRRLQHILIAKHQKFGGATKSIILERLVDYYYDFEHGDYCSHVNQSGEKDWHWGANGQWTFASCRLCGRDVFLERRLKAVAKAKPPHKTKSATDALMVDGGGTGDAEANFVSEALWADMAGDEMAMDTCCRRSVAGED